jgi:hypothetical protein
MQQHTTREIKPCYAAGCRERISRRMLMCLRHWRMVPAAIQAEVYDTVGLLGSDQSARPYVTAIARAQLAVAEKERKPAELLMDIRLEIEKLESGAVDG